MHVFQNMELFSELIQCGGNIYTWCYNADGSLLQQLPGGGVPLRRI